MSGADAVSDARISPGVVPTAAASALRPRRGLFRKYIVALVVLVAAALCINAGVEFWFSFGESKTALLALQQEKADAAAQRIGEFVTGVERQIGWTTLPLWGSAPIDQRRFDFVRLLRQVPAITDLTELDGDGKEQLKVSRLAMDVVGSGADYSHAPEFVEARANGVWFSPVSFRKESEPYMTLALADAGRNSGVTVASINLKLIWDVITALKIGEGGFAYVVDGRGKLIADPDISLVLRDTDFSKLPQVAAALASASADAAPVQTPTAAAADDYYGRPVLSAHARIKPLGWRVFVEVPLKEAYAPLYALALRNVMWLVLALASAALAAFLLARRMISPIRALQAGAAQIGAGALDRRIDIRTGDELEGLAGQFNRMAADLETSYAELEQRVRDRTAQLSEALDQQTATAEVLQVISRSTFDLDAVLQTVIIAAHRLCRADYSVLFRKDGEEYRWAAGYGISAEYEERERRAVIRPGPGTIIGRALLAGCAVQIADARTDPLYEGEAEGDAHTMLGVPLLRDGATIGGIGLARNRIEGFSERETQLVTTFADQAAIAIENARLLTETREALDQQTATAEVLGVINSSPGDLSPVFDAMLERALRLCEAVYGVLFTYDGEYFHLAAQRGFPQPELLEMGRDRPQPGPDTGFGRLARGERLVHIVDITDTDAYRNGDPIRRATADVLGARTCIFVALVKDDVLLGGMLAYRQEVRPFSDKQIALLQNFAAQAVIAMENARLITETREALEQQTATAEVLGVINSSPGDLMPVFEAILDKAHALCDAERGTLFLYDGVKMKAVVAHGYPADVVEHLRAGVDLAPHHVPLFSGNHVHVADLTKDNNATGRVVSGRGGVRTNLIVPLFRNGALLGMISCNRTEVRPFSGKEIALIENFAQQAVIAIENARLLTETQEALDQQTATAEVLGVINSSPGNLTPVFEAMLEKAMRLCEASFGSFATFDGTMFHAVAHQGVPHEVVEALSEPLAATPGGHLIRIVDGENVVPIDNFAETEAYRSGKQWAVPLVEKGGARTAIWVALRRDTALLGVLVIYRKEIRPFTDKQIALLQNFAAQAVIAIENARLITETQEALDRQTATAEVLQVINASPGDLAPVFEVMVERAANLCEADEAAVRTFDGELLHLVTTHGTDPAALQRLRGLGATRLSGMYEPFARGDDVVHYIDARETDAYRTMEVGRQRIDARGIRSWLAVALRKEGTLLGIINVHRREVRPFTDKQIALLQNFAAQAVIAIENTRLITETQEALDQQTATAEVLGVINSSPGNLKPVFDSMVEKALRLCEAAMGGLALYDEDHYRIVSNVGPPELVEFAAKPVPVVPGSSVDQLRQGKDAIQIEDITMVTGRPRSPGLVAMIELGKARTALWVALRKDDATIGFFAIYRQEVRPFTEKQIALLQNFAAQAVIAIENARLLEQIRQRQAELRVTFDNMGDGVVMFDGELRLAAWNKNFQELLDLPDALLGERKTYAEYLHILAARGEFGSGDVEEELSRRLAHADEELRFERTRPDGRVLEVRRNAVAGGGFVLIYSDITERKRSEEEIRAARDAAEAALRDLQTAQSRLIQAEKMASLGQLTAGIAHEIKNPLNFVNNFASLSNELLSELKEVAEPAIAALDADRREELDETMAMLSGNLEKIAEHGKRADNIVKSMLEHSRGVSGERRAVDLNALVEESLNLAYHGARAQDQTFNITLERAFDAALKPIELVPQDITRVFLNLIGNGFYAANKRAQRDGNGFRPMLKVATSEAGDAVEVKVRDNGTGIPPDIRDKLFQPFFTTKPTGEGTGLGLSISYDIVTQQHGGTIVVDSEENEFTEFTIRLPRGPATRAMGRSP